MMNLRLRYWVYTIYLDHVIFFYAVAIIGYANFKVYLKDF